ncbi:hypothetical protein AVEN_180181-1 [Araneus ventricosus]|uniref:Uncharacterized protein n=1 Tax=Araneus ventricosus TaxID=182803 RepID=A0A4Y2N2I7_ARAVE|nr:hypothetical protein AVEN_180181-1 [Araneus ventricosus]
MSMDAYFLGNWKGRVRRDGARDLGYQPAGERWERLNGAGLEKQNLKTLTLSFQQHLEKNLKSFRGTAYIFHGFVILTDTLAGPAYPEGCKTQNGPVGKINDHRENNKVMVSPAPIG